MDIKQSKSIILEQQKTKVVYFVVTLVEECSVPQRQVYQITQELD